MRARVAAVVAALVVLWTAGCERAPRSAPGTQAASAPVGASRATTQPAALRDWTREPAIAADEAQRPCTRLLSAAPNVTEICAALGLGPCLVGRTRYCAWPPEVAAVPTIGALNDLNAEALVELRPELVLVAGRSRAITERLEGLKLAHVSLPDDRLEDLFTSIGQAGERTGRVATAAALSAGVRAQLEDVAQAAAAMHVRPARVLITLAPMTDPPAQIHVAGPGSFYDDLLLRLGHANAAAGTGAMFTALSLERLIQIDPDVVIELVPEAGARGTDAAAREAWGRVGPLRAVRDGRVHVLVGPEHFLLGPRVARTMAALRDLIAEVGHE